MQDIPLTKSTPHRKPPWRLLRRLGWLGLAGSLLSLFVLLLISMPRATLVLPEPSLFLEDRNGQFLSEVGEGPLGFWPVGQIPQRLEASILAAEDRRFYQHRGVDFRALGRALKNNLQGHPRQGASTLPMQIARLQRPGPRTYPRKIMEMATAWHLVRRYDHKELLSHYLTIMPQGRRIHGAAYASRRYFQKPLRDVSWSEAALLAALPRGPGRMNFYQPAGLARAKARAGYILETLHQQGQLPEQLYQSAQDQLRQYQPPEREVRPFNALHAIQRSQEILATDTSRDRTKPIRTSLDLGLQDVVDELASKTLETLRGRGAGNVAVMVVEPATGKVLSYLGSDWYDDTDHAGAINYAQTPRSSGSTLKPFIYAFGLEKGHFQPHSILADLPLLTVDRSGHYGVSNFDRSYLGPLLLRRALANSRNIPAVSVLKQQGPQATFDFLWELGLIKGTHNAEFYGLGMAIGGVYVTLESLMGAYTTLANDGQSKPLSWFADGDTVTKPSAISETTARYITQFLSDPQARQPTFPRDSALEYAYPVAVKTGTSQGFRDAWCVAYSRKYLVGAWLGRPDHQPMNKINGTHAASLVKRIMDHLHPQMKEGVGLLPFPKPRYTEAVRLCPLSGHRAVSDCDRVAWEYLPVHRAPLPFSQVHQRFAVDKATGHQAGPTTPADRVQIRKALMLPGAYAVWASHQSLAPPPPPHQTQHHLILDIQMPIDGSRLHLDPGTPAKFQTLPLRAVVEPVVPHVMWYVDGKPFRKVSYPYEVRWPLQTGKHHFQVGLPNANIQSDVVSVTVSP